MGPVGRTPPTGRGIAHFVMGLLDHRFESSFARGPGPARDAPVSSREDQRERLVKGGARNTALVKPRVRGCTVASVNQRPEV